MSNYQVLLSVTIAAIGLGAPTDNSAAAPPTQQETRSHVGLATLLQEVAETDAAETRRLQLDDGDDTLREAMKMLQDTDANAVNPKDELNLDDVGDRDLESQDSDQKSLFKGRETSVSGSRFSLPPLAALTTATKNIGNGFIPKGFRGDAGDLIAPLPESGDQRGQAWHWNEKHWAAANTFSHPLYFEDRMLERHGHQRFPHIQSLVSGGRFLTDAFLLPYHSAIHPPSECQYTLGYYRTGNCVPALKQRPPYQRKAAAAQAAALVTAGWILP